MGHVKTTEIDKRIEASIRKIPCGASIGDMGA